MNKSTLSQRGQIVNRAWTQRSASGNGKNESSSQQQDLYSKLREYEGRRRLAYSSKLDSISLYWKSYCDLLSAALRETSRAQRVVLGTSHAYQLYAEAMQSIHDDSFLDDKGNITTNKKQRSKLAVTRKDLSMGVKRRDSSSTTAKDAVSVSVLKEIRESQTVLAKQFQESSKNMDEEISAAIGALLDTIQDSYAKIEQLGSSILVELEKTEQEVAQAWNTYLDSKNSSNVEKSGTAVVEEGKIVDPWVVEMQYRVAVAYQNLAWEKGNEILNAQLAKVKEEEISRRMNLREFLVAFAQRQQRLFLGLPGIQNQVLEDLVGKEMSREEMDKAVHTTIEERAAKYKKKTNGTFTGDMDKDDFAEFNLESPLSSDLLSKAKVVLRKGVSVDWSLCLAVMTADSFLHMFDLDDPKIKLSTSPEIAFTLLAPTLIVPCFDNQLLGKSNFGKGWSDPLTPTESLILAKCKVKRLDDTCFELTESVVTTGASKFMNKTSKRRMQLQSPTKEETDDWIRILSA